jgi:3-dehydroquinate synthase
MNRIKINLDKRSVKSHEIYIGRNILDRIGLVIAKKNWASRLFIITDSNVAKIHGESFRAALLESGLNAEQLVFPAGEKSKTIDTVMRLSGELMEKGADRQSGIIALGGGVVGDIAGFLASIFMRGIPYIQVPTTLIAQVDSSIGGKTGIDLPSGKNLLGTFSQPKAIFINIAFLKTLPAEELNNGLAEIIKYGIIDDPFILDELEKQPEALRSGDAAVLERIVAKCCGIKKAIVEIDETEKGIRRILNFGHTMGHAIEAESGYSISHGRAVVLGILGAVKVSERMGYLHEKDKMRIESLTAKLELPCRLPENIGTEAILARLKSDKKKEGDSVRFVLLKKIGMPFMNGSVPDNILSDVIRELRG